MLKRTAAAAALLGAASAASADGEWTANVGVSNNYIWRGLTQTTNEAAVSGGIDYANENGFYVGTWASNVQYAADDVYSYEHDVYFGYGGEVGAIGYDVGYLYYNYDREAEFDFAEIYGSISIEGFTFGVNVLAHTEAEEDDSINDDFGFGKAYYAYADYAFEVKEGLEVGFHIGYHEGDFVNAFNGFENYIDYNISIAKDGFSFMLSTTDVDDVGPDNLDNDEVKFVVGYSIDFSL
ncbi:MAG: TorF family putative porin [Pseudomonadota bacterium]